MNLVYGFGALATLHREQIFSELGPDVVIFDRSLTNSGLSSIYGKDILTEDNLASLPRDTRVHICIRDFLPVIHDLSLVGFTNFSTAVFERSECFFGGFRAIERSSIDLPEDPVPFRGAVPDEYIYISGASRGIGRVAAQELAKRGFNLVTASKDAAGLDRLVECLSPYGVDIITSVVDFTSPESISEHTQWLSDNKLRITGGFINAGISVSAHEGSLDDCSAFAISEMMNCNVVAPICLVSALLKTVPIDRAYKRVPIVITGSTIGGSRHELAYAASKGGLAKLVYDLRQIATTSSPTADFCLLDPGWVKTDMGSDFACNEVESVLPGVVLPFLVDLYTKTGWISAQRLSGMDLIEASGIARVYGEI